MTFHNYNISDKISSPGQLLYKVNSWRAKGFTIGFTNGCFDLLHHGHVAYMAEAKKHCSKLIIGVNSNNSVKQLNKGDNRPVNDEADRAYILAGLVFTDAIVIFDELTPIELIKTVQPDFLFKGGDYNAGSADVNDPRYIVGSREVKAAGGQVLTIPIVEGYSTTRILEKVNHK